MKHLLFASILSITFVLLTTIPSSAQDKNFIDQPYLETNARVDTLVTPDRIYLGILIKEEDTKGRTSVEEQENRMQAKLRQLGIDTRKQLTLSDLSSNFRDYFLRRTDVQKSKAFTLLVYDAKTAGDVIQGLEQIGISNITLEKTEVSNIESVKTAIRSKAITRAKRNGEAMLEPLGQSLGKALYISDLNTEYSNLQGQARGLRLQEALMDKDNGYQAIDVGFEKIAVEAMVQVRFAIQ